MNGREETAVQSTSLRDELGYLLGLACPFRHMGFDTVQGPGTPALGGQLPAENVVLSEIHVGCENVHVCTVHRQTQVIFLKRTLPAAIILQRNITIRRKSTRQDGGCTQTHSPTVYRIFWTSCIQNSVLRRGR